MIPPALALALSRLGVVAPPPTPRPTMPAPWMPKRPGDEPPF